MASGWLELAKRKRHPRYWLRQEGQWFEYTLYGLLPLKASLPVCHINYHEADAFARWNDKRLPSEQEWGYVCSRHDLTPGHEPISLRPRSADREDKLAQMFGDLWQWTRSSYSAYPGCRVAAGAIGEYSGKFMCNQMVLRGSSCVTPSGHARQSYRNFFYSKDQWQLSGICLADDL